MPAEYEDPDDEENSFVVVPSERKFPRAIERIQGDVGFKKANIICENVNDKLAAELGEVLTRNKTLETLNLYLNKITDIGAVAIAQAITPVSALTELNLGTNKVGDEGARAIAASLTANASMKKLILDRNRISPEGAHSLSVALERNTSLESLYLHRNQIGDDGARAIGKCLCYNSTLRMLQLDENGITDAGIAGLSIGIEQNKGVEHLHLNFNKIADPGVQRLAKSLFKNRTLRVLRLSNNQITDNGVVGQGSLGDMMAQNFMKLEKLYIDQNRISEEAGRRLAKDLHRRNRGFKFLHFTVRNKVSLERQKKNEDLKTMANVDDSDDEQTTQEQVEQFVHKMKSHNAHVQQRAAREFLELLHWSEHERGHDIERFRRQCDEHQLVLDGQITELEVAREKLENVTDEFDVVQHQIQLLIDDNEFVSMKMVHEKQEKERAMREAQATVDGLEAARQESTLQVATAEQEISALHEGNEVQLRSPDVGAVGALLHMLYPKGESRRHACA
jgi:Ran GTPase-activating protein (RanGAP) involved in mRNA processing and transport